MIAIVITAYNRPRSLRNLLNSISHIRRHPEINSLPVIISIDNGGTDEVNRIANEFSWDYGDVEVIIHKEKKGLVKHFIWVGNQTEKYDQVIFLEDDLLVSPNILYFVKPMIDYYKDVKDVAAASLYNPVLIEATGTKFYQLEDGNDVYFLQHPYWGNVWFKNKWMLFQKFLENYTTPNNSILPPNIASWDSSFKKIYIQFLIESNLTVVYPRVSLVTNNGDSGIHSGEMFEYQSNLQLVKNDYTFTLPSNSQAKYDAFFEIYPEILKHYNPFLRDYDFEMDLNGTRQNYNKPYVITSRSTTEIVKSFSALMKPTELAIALNLDANGRKVSLCNSDTVDLTSRRYMRTRRYLDIRKNYHIGIITSYQISKHLIKELIRVILVKAHLK